MQINSIKEAILIVLKKHSIKKAAIFGSFARNEANENSDIDLLIESNTTFTLFDLLRLEQELADATSRKIDVVEYSALKNSIRKQVMNDAISIL